MVKSGGLNHINLNVADIDRSLRFYQEAFGLEVKFWEGRRMVFLRSPGASDTITLHQVDKGAPVGPAGVAHFGFALSEKGKLDEAILQVERAGGKLIGRGDRAPGASYAYVSDPDGYVIELGNQ
jgi:lactoylglutathione lyase